MGGSASKSSSAFTSQTGSSTSISEPSSRSSEKSHLVILAPRALLPGEDEPCAATLRVDRTTGRFVSVQKGLQESLDDEATVLRVQPHHVLCPGLVDTHVHLNQPGRTEWEGFETGTLAAISGGVTTLIDMPLNSIPPSTTVHNLDVKRQEAERIGVRSDLGFWGGLIPGNAGDLKGLLKAGAKGFKCFLIDSGVEEFPCVSESDLIKACDALEGTSGLILFHAELDCASHDHPGRPSHPEEYATFLASRPPSLELEALDLVLRLARQYPDLRFHIVHLSASSALPLIRKARQDGVKNLTVETCFHYLTLAAERIPNNATVFKCCPPVREETNRQKIINAVVDGTIDFVVSDHSPCVPELKAGDFMSAWGGISGLGLGLSLMHHEMHDRMSLGKMIDALSSRQAKQVGLEGRKGALQEGADADFIIFDPEEKRTVTLETLRFKNKVSPYLGMNLRGWVQQTYLGGRLVFDRGEPVGGPAGKLI